MMEAKYIERLEQVVRVLKELPKEKRFDLKNWMQCGTSGCAVGWAASDPWFTRRGLKLGKAIGRMYPLSFRGHNDWKAAEAFFNLSRGNTRNLFSTESYARGSRYDVIRRLNSFIREQRKEAA